MIFWNEKEFKQLLANNLSLYSFFKGGVFNGKPISKIECKWVTRVKKPYNDDMHIVREKIFFKDGSNTINIRLVKNFKRP